MSRIGMPSTQLVVSTSAAVWSQLDRGDDEAFVVLDVLGNLRDRRCLEPQVELEPRRAVQRLDHLGRPQPPRVGDQPLGQPRAAHNSFRYRRTKRARDAGPQDLDRNRPRAPSAGTSLGLVHLRDRGRGDRRRQFGEFGALLPSASSSMAGTSAASNGSILSCSPARSAATSAPTMSGRVARVWPNLT